MKSIFKYGLELRPVKVDDAEMLVKFRTDERRSRFISSTDIDISKQKDWIEAYKSREAEGKEYYFIAVDDAGYEFCTYRVYNIQEDIAEIGSWVTKPKYPNALNSIKVDIIMKEFVFETLKLEILNFEVRRQNLSVVRYHKLFEPSIIKETEQDIYFVLNKESFYKNRLSKFKNII